MVTIIRKVTALLVCLIAVTLARLPAQSSPSATTPSGSSQPQTSASSPSAEPATIESATQLYRARKLDAAAAEFQRVIEAGISAPAGYAGLARVYLRQDKLDEAQAAAQKGLELGPNLAATHVAIGEVDYRLGKIEEAAEEFRRLVKLNTSDARAYYGLSRVMHISSYHQKAKALLDRAHELDPKDPDILYAWMNTLAGKDRVQSIETALAMNSLDEQEKRSAMRTLSLLKEIGAHPGRACSLAASVTSTQAPLMPILVDAKRATGYGLRVKLNGNSITLLLDTGASGVLVTSRAAEKAGVEKVTEAHFGGIGDRGEQEGYIGFAQNIQVGELSFQNCYVGVVEKGLSSSEDGLLGADVFSDFLVELNFPDQKLLLSKLPADPALPTQTPGLSTQSLPPARFHDRYVAPEMKSFVPIYRVGHALLIPSKFNNAGPYLLLIDSGSVEDLLNLNMARQFAKVDNPRTWKMKGISGEVNNVYRARDVAMQIPGFSQRFDSILAIDLDNFGRGFGVRQVGILGFETLHMLDIKIDYQDGLVQFGFNALRWTPR